MKKNTVKTIRWINDIDSDSAANLLQDLPPHDLRWWENQFIADDELKKLRSSFSRHSFDYLK